MILVRALVACLVFAGFAQAAESTFTFRHEHVLGTSLEIQVTADSAEIASAAEARVLAAIERLNRVFSTYDADSEFSRWQQTMNSAERVSPELHEVLAASERWTKLSRGAFQPGAEALSRVWAQAAKQNALPSVAELTAATKLANETHWTLSPDGAAIRRGDCPLSLNAIAKGAIVEWACQGACADEAVKGLIVNLGGDLRVCGSAGRQVTIADPRNDAENAPPIGKIFVANRAVATSGDYRRGFTIAGKRYSHILDPRTGRPNTEVSSATIVAKSSADADALATICNVLPAAEGLALLDSLPEVDGLLITSDGKQHASAGWGELAAPKPIRFTALKVADDDKPAAKPELHELLVKFELDRPPGGRYHRPYVAVWLENADEFPVKTAVLWMQTKQPGPRWHRDLLRWYRRDLVRKEAEGAPLIGTVSAATRGPGEYSAMFDGLDDAGKPLKPGKYTLFIEAAREKGTYQLIRQPLELGADAIEETSLKGNVEVKAASYVYRPREAAESK